MAPGGAGSPPRTPYCTFLASRMGTNDALRKERACPSCKAGQSQGFEGRQETEQEPQHHYCVRTTLACVSSSSCTTSSTPRSVDITTYWPGGTTWKRWTSSLQAAQQHSFLPPPHLTLQLSLHISFTDPSLQKFSTAYSSTRSLACWRQQQLWQVGANTGQIQPRTTTATAEAGTPPWTHQRRLGRGAWEGRPC